MNITELSIRNFKSIRCLTMHNMEQALILVGKNSTGKTVVLDAILAYLKPEQWDNKKLIVKNHPNADALNRLIYEFVATIEKRNWNYGSKVSESL